MKVCDEGVCVYVSVYLLLCDEGVQGSTGGQVYYWSRNPLNETLQILRLNRTSVLDRTEPPHTHTHTHTHSYYVCL